MTSAARFSLIVLMALAASACGDDSPMKPTSGPIIACPASQRVESPDGASVVVTFPPPTVTGGTAPVTTTCTNQSGARFEVGTTDVACTARDANQSAASCGFRITVEVLPRLKATRFVAFGDSITAGSLPATCSLGTPLVSRCTTTLRPWLPLLPLTPEQQLLDNQFLKRGLQAAGDSSGASYPLKLKALLGSRYTSQSIVVTNEGEPGETADSGSERLPQVLTKDAPEVLLLLEGINDIHQPGDQAEHVGPLVEALKTMIRQARSRGVRVFVSTLLPEDPCGCRAFDFVDEVDDIVTANNQIRAIAATEGAVLVDMYQVFAGQTSTLLSLDGLHPNETGYQRMAETFFDAIRQQLEAK
jgi:lysophospholipase L1-like esterase